MSIAQCVPICPVLDIIEHFLSDLLLKNILQNTNIKKIIYKSNLVMLEGLGGETCWSNYKYQQK